MQPTRFLVSLEKSESGNTGTIKNNNPFLYAQAVADAAGALTLFPGHSWVPYMLMDSSESTCSSLPGSVPCSECAGLVHSTEWQGPGLTP